MIATFNNKYSPFSLQAIDSHYHYPMLSIHVKYCIDGTIFSLIFICFNNFNNRKWLYDWFWFWINFLSNHGNKAKKKNIVVLPSATDPSPKIKF